MIWQNGCCRVLGLMLLIAAWWAPRTGYGQGLPLIDGKQAAALVEDEAITLDYFTQQLGSDQERDRAKQGKATKQDLDLLNRLITIKLIAHEGERMGLADLPEIRSQVEVTARGTLREVLLEQKVRDIKPDEATVEKIYRDLVREWKTASLLFQKEEAAKSVRGQIAKGGDYDAIAAKVLKEGAAKSEGDEAYHRVKDYLPEIAQSLQKLEVGSVSEVISLQAGFVILKVLDIRYPDDSDARAQAVQMALNQKQQVELQAYEKSLRAKYVVVRKAVFEKLDYAAKEPGFEALLKDKRILAEIKGEEPVTIEDLTDYLRMQLFHGPDQTEQGKRLNSRKTAAFEAMLSRRVLNKEALSLGIDKSDAYNSKVREFEESLIFDTFVQKVIVPESKLKEEEVHSYYDEHLSDYTSPEMIKMRSLALGTRAAAEDAIAKLRAGADYNWLVANAEGRLKSGTEGLLDLDGKLLTTESMPEGLRKEVVGAKKGEIKLYASPEDHFYTLRIEDVFPAQPKAYDEVKEEIAKKLFNEKLRKGVEDYAAKLRSLSKVEIYLKAID